MERVWRRLEHSETTPELNLAIDEALVRGKAEGDSPSTLRLWRNPPCIVIGISQNPFVEIDLAACQELGLPVVRRQSGGGAVYHDAGNMNYSLIVEREALGPHISTERSYAFLLQGVVNALGRFGVTAHVRNTSDVFVDDRKIAGCAQYRTGNAVLHHGCLLVDSDLLRLDRALRVPAVWYREVVNLAELAQPVPTLERVADALAASFAELFGVVLSIGAISALEQARAAELHVAKYSRKDWHLRVSPGWRPGRYGPR